MRSTIVRAIPMNSAKTMTAMMSPRKALTIASTGFCGMRSRRICRPVLGAGGAWTLCADLPITSSSAARDASESPAPGRTRFASATPIRTEIELRTTVKRSVLAPTRPRRRTSPSSATPRIKADTISGITTMKMRRRKICPAG